jgi:peptidyl-prolyl cis-trans isomerase B (cyclophilin B)
MKRLLCLALSLLFLCFPLVSCEKEKVHTPPAANEIDFSTVSDLSKVTETENETDYVLITVEDFGQILVRLYPDVAPETVANFKKLVSEKFYDGLTFHRIIEGFMIQGGDPSGNGIGGSSQKIKGEFASNGFENNLPHNRGVLSMARSNAPDSASSQFFIVHKTEGSTHLNGNYAAFGFVVYGMDVVDKIAELPTFSNDYPHRTVKMTSIRFAKVEA